MVEAKIGIVGSNVDGKVVFDASAPTIRVVEFQNGSLEILEAEVKAVCAGCQACAGVERITNPGGEAIISDEKHAELLRAKKCPLVGKRVFLNMDNVETGKRYID